MHRIKVRPATGVNPVSFLTEFNDQSEDDSLTIPEDLSTLSDEDLAELHNTAAEAFNALYGDGSGPFSDADLATLSTLTDAVEALQAEVSAREAAQAERAEAAAELAARIGLASEADEDEDEDVDENEELASNDESDEDESEDGEGGGTDDTVTASGPRTVNLAGIRQRQKATPKPPAKQDQKPVLSDFLRAAPQAAGLAAGQKVELADLSASLDERLRGFSQSTFEAARRSGRHLRERHGLAVVHKPFSDDLKIMNDGRQHVAEVMKRAADESRLPGGSLVAAAGWCAPSETLYDLYDSGESRDGLLSIPEVGVSRGGIRYTTGISFQSVYNGTGFEYTEEEVIDGDFDGEGGGSKPCYSIPCPEFTEKRLDAVGLCLTAGLLQVRGYPEVVSDVIAKALIAHDHRVSARLLSGMATDSTAVTMPSDTVGTTAPLLRAVELQVEHYRYVHRLARGVTLEAVFPYWVRGAIRSDLALRLGVDLISVPDARIDGWFRERGINPQFVYNWQSLTGNADDFVSWPDTVQFLLYRAGTWIKGGSDVITLDSVFDSVGLGENEYTALFSEEGVALIKRGIDSRVVTVPVCSSGATSGGVLLDCDGVAVVEETTTP